MNWIDPHIHFFALQHGHYDWLKPNNPPYWRDKSVIARSVYERDLFKGNHATLGGFVHIEAGFDNGQPWREVVFLEQHCVKPFRSVANIDLRSSTSLSDIDRLKRFRSVVGLRHILDDDAATLAESNNETARGDGLFPEPSVSSKQGDLANHILHSDM